MPKSMFLGSIKSEEGSNKSKNRRDGRKSAETLGEREYVPLSKLPQILKEKGEVVYQALGWLAKEAKVDFHKREGKTFASLSSEEREIFRKSL